MHDFKLQHRGNKITCAAHSLKLVCMKSRQQIQCEVSSLLLKDICQWCVDSTVIHQEHTNREAAVPCTLTCAYIKKKKKIFLDVQQDAVSFLLHWPDRHSIWIITALTLSYTVEIVFTYGCAGPWLHMVFWDSQKNLNRVKLRTLKISREKKW